MISFRSFPNERQYDAKDCGPACLKAIAKFYGRYYSLHYLRETCGISREGVSLLDLSYAAEHIGFRSLSIKTTMNDLAEKVQWPCIVHWDNNHFVVVYRATKRRIYVADPAKGLISYSHKEFSERWYKRDEAMGYILALEPASDFHTKESEDLLNSSKNLFNVISYFRPYKKSVINLLVVMLIVVVLESLLPFISKAVIDVGIQAQDLSFINLVLVANIAIAISVTGANAIRNWILLHIAARINIALISDYLIKLMKLPVTFFENKLTGDILQRANDLERIRSFIMDNSLSLVFSSLTFLVFSCVLLSFNLLIFYAFMVGSIVYVLWVLAFFRLRKKLDWNYFHLISKNQSYWVETINCIQDIKINNYEKYKRWKWEGIQAKLYRVTKRGVNINNIQSSGATLIETLKNLFITYFSAKAVIDGEITLGVMIATQFIIGMLNGPVQQVLHFIMSAQFAKISFMRINEIQQLQDEDEGMGNNSIELPEQKGLTIKDLSFQYSRNAPFVVQNVNLFIPQGMVTALVGDSGSGKSTLLKLILRLYQPSYGDILMGKMNINNVSLRQWRDSCGAVMQDGKVFNDTILNNIILDDENVDYDRLRNAVETANIVNEIEQLPLGYQTTMGEQGRGLSGGQKQRLLIARALYKNPEYLFFDEATNALDTINEKKIVDALENVFKGKTVIIVAHRLSTIRKADQIVVMKNGRVIEIGNHESLMAQNGHYCQLVNAQIESTSNIVIN